MMAHMDSLGPLDHFRLAMQELEDSRRTVLCPPRWKADVEAEVERRGLGGVWTVEVTRYLADDKIVILDPNAIEAGRRQAGLKALRDYRADPEPPFEVEDGEWLRP